MKKVICIIMMVCMLLCSCSIVPISSAECAARVDERMRTGWWAGGPYTVTQDNDNVIRVNYWDSGISHLAWQAICGNEDAAMAWVEIKSDADGLANEIYDYCRSQTHNDDIHVYVCLMNDLAPNRELLGYMNGELYYNTCEDDALAEASLSSMIFTV